MHGDRSCMAGSPAGPTAEREGSLKPPEPLCPYVGSKRNQGPDPQVIEDTYQWSQPLHQSMPQTISYDWQYPFVKCMPQTVSYDRQSCFRSVHFSFLSTSCYSFFCHQRLISLASDIQTSHGIYSLISTFFFLPQNNALRMPSTELERWLNG